MNQKPWLEALEHLRRSMPDCNWPPESEVAPTDLDHLPTCTTIDFFEQVVRGQWPVRVPVVMEIWAEGTEPRLRGLRPGDKRHNGDSQIITIHLEFDRAKVREMMLADVHAADRRPSSKLPHMAGLIWVDRDCFLQTAAAHFVETLANGDEPLRRDSWFMEFLRELYECDADLIVEVVAATLARESAAGARLRDLILERLSDPQVCDHLGWLGAAMVTERLQDLEE
ncbi:MAG: hypothetical protein AB7O59_14160 [Pirellulales bacterium]